MRRVVALLATLLALVCVCDGVTFGQLCSGNTNNNIRNDSQGDGHYGARRGTRTHIGLDIVCQDGSVVYAPIDMTIQGNITVYTDRRKDPINSGIKATGGGLCFKLFYVKPDRTSGTVNKGAQIGTMLPMQSVYPGMTSHIHVQMCDESNPTGYF